MIKRFILSSLKGIRKDIIKDIGKIDLLVGQKACDFLKEDA